MVKHSERWITWLVAAMDDHLDEETKAKILKQCGRQCQTESLTKKARDIYKKSNSLNDFLKKFGQVYGNLHLEGDEVFIIYPKCYCPNVNKIPSEKLSATYCNCSRGWIEALFEDVLGQQIDVVKHKSIVNGDEECKFQIIL